MKLLVCSDSHGLISELKLIKERHPECEYYIHCGDFELDENSRHLKDFVYVIGNNDYFNGNTDVILELEGKKIFITHGHTYGIHMGFDRLIYKAMELNADYCLYGHTHRFKLDIVENIQFVNPGSVGFPRGHRIRTYAIIDLNDDSVIFHEVLSGDVVEPFDY